MGGNPIHLCLGDADLPAPTLMPAARECHAASFTRLDDRPSHWRETLPSLSRRLLKKTVQQGRSE
jgi:hypothetical protein